MDSLPNHHNFWYSKTKVSKHLSKKNNNKANHKSKNREEEVNVRLKFKVLACLLVCCLLCLLLKIVLFCFFNFLLCDLRSNNDLLNEGGLPMLNMATNQKSINQKWKKKNINIFV